jgi:hypothetical protein
MHEAKPLLFCPGCNSAKVPGLGERCKSVRNGAACGVRRCWRCAALCRRTLRCGHCGAVQPLELRVTWVDLEEEDKLRREGTWPPRRVGIAVDEDTGLVWVQASAWPRLQDSGYATRLVLEAAMELAQRKLELVGRYTVVRGTAGETLDIKKSWSLDRKDRLETFLMELDGRLITLDVATDKNRPYADVKPPAPTITVDVRKLLEALRLATLRINDGFFWASRGPGVGRLAHPHA